MDGLTYVAGVWRGIAAELLGVKCVKTRWTCDVPEWILCSSWCAELKQWFLRVTNWLLKSCEKLIKSYNVVQWYLVFLLKCSQKAVGWKVLNGTNDRLQAVIRIKTCLVSLCHYGIIWLIIERKVCKVTAFFWHMQVLFAYMRFFLYLCTQIACSRHLKELWLRKTK